MVLSVRTKCAEVAGQPQACVGSCKLANRRRFSDRAGNVNDLLNAELHDFGYAPFGNRIPLPIFFS